MTASSPTPALRFRTPETVLNALRGRGLRVTTPRRVVVNTLFAADRPLSADEIAAGLDGEQTPLDLASVYRNLEMLQRLGAVRHLHAGHRPGRYVLSGAGAREYLACERCGVLAGVDPAELDRIRAELRERFGYTARFTHFPIVGVCRECEEERAPQSTRGGSAS